MVRTCKRHGRNLGNGRLDGRWTKLGYFARSIADSQKHKAYYATASGVVEDSGVVAPGSSGVGVSSTPWPLHRGQELRPVVSHCGKISKRSMAVCGDIV